MRLNKPQALALEEFRRYRSKQPSYVGYLRKNWWRYLIFVILFLLFALLGFAMGDSWVVAFVAGLLFGIVMVEESNVRHFRRLWPAMAAVLDWERIDQLLEERINRLRQSKSAGPSPKDESAPPDS